MDKKVIKKLRIERIKLQIEILELERRIEEAYLNGSPEFQPFIRQAEILILKGKEMLENTKLG